MISFSLLLEVYGLWNVVGWRRFIVRKYSGRLMNSVSGRNSSWMKFYSWKEKAKRNLRQLTKLPSHCKSKKRCKVVTRELRPDFPGHPKKIRGFCMGFRRPEGAQTILRFGLQSFTVEQRVDVHNGRENPHIPKIPAFPKWPFRAFRGQFSAGFTITSHRTIFRHKRAYPLCE